MAYFLRKTRRKNGDAYFQVYDSYYSLQEGRNRNKSVKALGALSRLRKPGETAAECEERLKGEVRKREAGRRSKPAAEIGDETVTNYGSFLLSRLVSFLGAGRQVDLLGYGSKKGYRLSDVLFPLAAARVIDPCSKLGTFTDVFPRRFPDPSEKLSLGQLYSGLCDLGKDRQDVIDVLNAAVGSRFGRNRGRAYFDCTNYYFEADCEGGLRRKGPSKENRTGPIVSMALLLDSDLIPVRMEVFPGNLSEKPFLPSAIAMARQEGRKGKIVQVADKGLNCAENVFRCGKDGGYIFSKSPKTLSEDDVGWRLSGDGWTDVRDSGGDLSFRYKSVTGRYEYEFRDGSGKRVRFSKREKRVATFNPSLRKKQSSEIVRQYAKAEKRTGRARIKEALGGKGAKYVAVDAVSRRTGEVLGGVSVEVSGDRGRLERDLMFAGYNLLVTSETGRKDEDVYGVYHRLGGIERTFRIRKTQLCARPVFLSTDDAIKGHFLTCYVAVLLLRLLERKVLGGKFAAEQIVSYVRKANVVRIGQDSYFNLRKRKDAAIGAYLQETAGLPLLSKVMTKNQIYKLFHPKKGLPFWQGK